MPILFFLLIAEGETSGTGVRPDGKPTGTAAAQMLIQRMTKMVYL